VSDILDLNPGAAAAAAAFPADELPPAGTADGPDPAALARMTSRMGALQWLLLAGSLVVFPPLGVLAVTLRVRALVLADRDDWSGAARVRAWSLRCAILSVLFGVSFTAALGVAGLRSILGL